MLTTLETTWQNDVKSTGEWELSWRKTNACFIQADTGIWRRLRAAGWDVWWCEGKLDWKRHLKKSDLKSWEQDECPREVEKKKKSDTMTLSSFPIDPSLIQTGLTFLLGFQQSAEQCGTWVLWHFREICTSYCCKHPQISRSRFQGFCWRQLTT